MPQAVASSNRLEEKTLKAGWWQEAFRKVFVRNIVEEVPYLKCIASTMNFMKGASRYHGRNLANTYLGMCTKRIAANSTTQFLQILEQVWGSYFLMLLELLGGNLEANPEWIQACSHMGRAYGLIFALHTLEHAPVTNCVLLPEDLMKASGVTLDDLHSKNFHAGTQTLVYELNHLMQEESMLCAIAGRTIPYHFKQLVFFRYRV